MIRLSRLYLLLVLVFTLIAVGTLSLMQYQALRTYAADNLTSELKGEAFRIRDGLERQLIGLKEGLRLLTGHESIIKGLSTLIYSAQVQSRFEALSNRYGTISSLYLLTPDGKVKENYGGRIRPLEQDATLQARLAKLRKAANEGLQGGAIWSLKDPLLLPEGNNEGLVFATVVTSFGLRQQEAVQGFLLALVPFNRLHKQQEVEDSTVLEIAPQLTTLSRNTVSQTLSLDIQDRDFTDALTLYIRVSRSIESMDSATKEFIRPFLVVQLLVMLFLMVLLSLSSTPVLRAFNGLNGIIQRMEAGLPVQNSNTRIWEFAHTERLLMEMQGRIHEQLADLERQNHQLESLANEKDLYLKELTQLNQSLESKVEERTNTLALSLQRIEITNRFYNQLILLRQQLTDDSSPQQVLKSALKHLTACELGLPFAISLSLGEPMVTVQHKDDDFPLHNPAPRYRSDEDYTLEDGVYSFSLPTNHGSGWLQVAARSLRDEELKGLLLFARELGGYLEKRALNNKLAFWARTDGLTGLGNRIAFDQLMGDLETALDTEVGLFLVDVNGLKELNDSQGHEAGDALLQTVAARLRSCVQGVTSYLYRIGGDEYVIVLTGEGLNQRSWLQKRLDEVQFQPATLAGRERGISFSVGYADTHGTHLASLYRMADKAMYQQKQQYYDLKRHANLGETQKVEESSESV
ncbi:GGDEF domain-containing protein [Pseudaeromonas sp. ZJS20]|uniref:GGDEF domain-containing protein n=1 Tax=Pseudaeromonas aegiceratis TaxID=3153928 RepID=UPI00390CC786